MRGMYLIANSSANEVTLTDLGITLYPRQAIDLHKVKLPINPDVSKDLEHAKSKGKIKVLHKDAAVPQVQEIKQEIIVKDGINKEELLGEMKNMLQEEIKKQISNISIPQQNNGGNEQMELLKKLMEMMQQRPVSSPQQTISAPEDSDIDMEKMAQIHAKSAKRMSKDVEGSVGAKEEKVKDDSIINNASELEGLI